MQIASIRRTIPRLQRAHMIDLHIRINGKWDVVQCDWLKHLNIDCLKVTESDI